MISVTLGSLYPLERPGIHCIRGWMGIRAGLDGCGKSRPPTGIRFLDPPASNESLYGLRYPGPRFIVCITGCLWQSSGLWSPLFRRETSVTSVVGFDRTMLVCVLPFLCPSYIVIYIITSKFHMNTPLLLLLLLLLFSIYVNELIVIWNHI